MKVVFLLSLLSVFPTCSHGHGDNHKGLHAVHTADTDELSARDRMTVINSVLEKNRMDQLEKQVLAMANETLRRKRPISINFVSDSDILDMGRARANYERVVRLAEAELVKFRYRDTLNGTDTQAQVQALAKAAFHIPGQLLNKEELLHIQYEVGMDNCMMVRDPPTCDPKAKFRSIDGTCNNLQNPLWGASKIPFRRLLPQRYEDGIQQPRGYFQARNMDFINRGPFDAPNPSVRLISRTVHTDEPIDDPIHTHMMMQWGQFLDHDITLAPEFTEEDCPQSLCEFSEECIPIQVRPNEPITGDDKCLFFPRSIPVCDNHGEFSVRNQLNLLTSYIDGSQIYGSDKLQAAFLRSFTSGKLRTGRSALKRGKPSLPYEKRRNAQGTGCPERLSRCFVSGDPRTNEQVGLTVMHTIWMREHNRIAKRLGNINPHWNDETLYQTARSIVIAELQAITYEEYLHEVLGRDLYKELIGPYQGYNNTSDPTISSVFATAAFRFGHTQIRPELDRLQKNGKPIEKGALPLYKAFFNPEEFFEGEGTDPIIRGFLSVPTRMVDEFMNSVITNELFKSPTSLARDLVSLNLQRGRDHGLPPYPIIRDFCQSYLRSRNVDAPAIINEATLMQFYTLYGSLDTVDAFSGMLAEKNISSANSESVVGPTMACIFSITFNNLRNGDRFYYQNQGTFTCKQVASLRQSSLSKVLCDNADNFPKIQKNAFKLVKLFNPSVSCDSIPTPNLNLWRENTQTGDCWARITARNAPLGFLLAVSIRNDDDPGRQKSLIDGQNKVCVEWVCPPTRESNVRVVPSERGCWVTSNTGLPRSRRYYGYENDWPVASLIPGNGIYRSLRSCEAGRATALKWTCRGNKNSWQTKTSSSEPDDEVDIKEEILINALEEALDNI